MSGGTKPVMTGAKSTDAILEPPADQHKQNLQVQKNIRKDIYLMITNVHQYVRLYVKCFDESMILFSVGLNYSVTHFICLILVTYSPM